MEDRWYSLQEMEEHLGIKRDTILKWVKEKEMPAHKMGRAWKFKKDDVDDWVRSGMASE